MYGYPFDKDPTVLENTNPNLVTITYWDPVTGTIGRGCYINLAAAASTFWLEPVITTRTFRRRLWLSSTLYSTLLCQAHTPTRHEVRDALWKGAGAF